jgi:hypothetical protein
VVKRRRDACDTHQEGPPEQPHAHTRYTEGQCADQRYTDERVVTWEGRIGRVGNERRDPKLHEWAWPIQYALEDEPETYAHGSGHTSGEHGSAGWRG